MNSLDEKLQAAREMSWETFGKKLTFYVPGMIRCDGVSGKYQAVSITGEACALQCEHCKGELLRSMIRAATPRALVDQCIQLAERGNHVATETGACHGAPFFLPSGKSRTGPVSSCRCTAVSWILPRRAA